MREHISAILMISSFNRFSSRAAWICFVALFCFALAGCRRNGKTPHVQERVVLYCSVDEVYVKPIIRDLEQKTGLQIDVLYDTEAAKTAGLATRIRAERRRPRGDVFWSSALLQTLLLGREDLLQPYVSPSARYVSPAFKDSSGLWTAVGLRARTIVYRRGLKNPPRDLHDLLSPRWKNKIGISNPQFGTASDWASALAVRWGKQDAMRYFSALKANGVRILPGNSVVAEKVARGELLAGVCDPDDFEEQRLKSGGQIEAAPFLPATKNAASRPSGEVEVPGSIALLKNAPNARAAKKLIDALLAAETEKQLASHMKGIALVHPAASFQHAIEGETFIYAPEGTPDDTAQWPRGWDAVREPLAAMLMR